MFDTTLSIYTGTTVSGLTAAATNSTLDDVQPGVVQSSVGTFNAVGGTVYYIAVDGFNNSDGHGADSGAITLNLSYTALGSTTTSTTTTSTAPSSSITTTTIPPTGGGSSGGGGGGGAPSVWFLGALSLLVFARRLLPTEE